MEYTKGTTVELKNIETMPCKEFNDMLGELLKVRYPEADAVSVNMQKVYHGVDFFSGLAVSREIKVTVQYN